MDTTQAQQSKLAEDKSKEQENKLVFSYLTLRNFIGFSGLLLPIVLPLFSDRNENEDVIQGSISAYYYTSMGDIFVIVICILSAFLFTYKGYNEIIERILLFTAAACGFLLTYFPTEWEEGMLAASVHVQNHKVPKINGTIEWHWIFAGTFFVSLSFISIFFFTQGKHNKWFSRSDGRLTQKSRRNIVYISTGCLMLASMLVILIYAVTQSTAKIFGNVSVIFAMETIAIVAFGISWITKGETLFPDSATNHFLMNLYRKIVRKKIEKPVAVA